MEKNKNVADKADMAGNKNGETTEAFGKNLDAIRSMMKDLKEEKYALKNPETAALGDYRESLYLRILCSLIQYEKNPSDMQILMLRRIVEGIGTEENYEEHLRRALELSESDVQEFLSLFADQRAKYYFAVDGLLLFALGERGKVCEYLAEILELLDIGKDDLEYLCMVVRSILRQQPSDYDLSKDMVNERVKGLDFIPYIGNYYAGAMIDTAMEKYYYAPDKKRSEGLKFPERFRERKVVFQNLRMELPGDMKFEGCEEVAFIDCELISKGGRLGFSSVGRLSFLRCKASGFQNRVAYIESINNFEVENCEFQECGYTCDGDESGGVFAISNDGDTEIIRLILVGNQLLNCYIGAKTCRNNYFATGVFLGFLDESNIQTAKICDNSFAGCRCINNGRDYEDAMVGECSIYNELRLGNNHSTGKVTRIFADGDMENAELMENEENLREYIVNL